MRKTCLNWIYEAAKRDPRVVFIGSDLGHGVLEAFRCEMPERFFMEGVSEAHIVGMAAGLAKEGAVVYINTIATFLTRRCFEQVVLDAALHNLPVRLIGSGGGLVYAPLGHTHLAVDDTALMRAVPGMGIFSPADAVELEQLMPCTLSLPGPCYIRLAKGGDPVITGPGGFPGPGKAVRLREGGDVVLAVTGRMAQVGLEAARLLEAAGVSALVLHFPTIKPLDQEALTRAARSAPVLVALEEHSLCGGFLGAVAETLAALDTGKPVYRALGLPDVFIDRYGTQEELWAHFGLTPENTAGTALRALAAAGKGRRADRGNAPA